MPTTPTGDLIIRGTLREEYRDVYTDEALAALRALAHFDADGRR